MNGCKSIFLFFLHGCIIYYAKFYGRTRGRGRREWLLRKNAGGGKIMKNWEKKNHIKHKSPRLYSQGKNKLKMKGGVRNKGKGKYFPLPFSLCIINI